MTDRRLSPDKLSEITLAVPDAARGRMGTGRADPAGRLGLYSR